MSAALEAAMLDAHRAGLSVIPLRSNKRPDVPSWKQYIDDQPDLIMVQEWARRAEGFAILCGGATRLQVLDFEGRFMEHIPELRARLGDELAAVFESWLDGYFVATPGGGFHVAVHVEGDDQPGNIKLAADGMQQCMVETRGHGGYVVAAPSNGTTHPSGQPWGQVRGTFAEIAWATAEQWRAICAAISTFDVVAAASETPPEVPSPRSLPGGVSLSRIEHTSSWIENVQLPPIEDVLERAGWTYSHSDAEHNYWSRPGKPPHEGHSATVNRNGRLFVFSTNAAPIPASAGRTTYDVVDVIGYLTDRFYHHENLAARTVVLRTFAGLSAQHPPAVRESPALGAGWLPDDFWTATEWLSEIRSAAHGNGKCPEALLGAVLSAYSVRIPSSIRVAPIVHGVASPLNLYVALAGPSGSGKSSTMAMAQELCGAYDDELYRYGINLRSGEGLVTASIIPQQTKRGEPPPEVRYRLGLQVEFDEGKTLAVQNDRSGSTMVPYLTTAWSGQKGKRVGGTKAAGDESFPADMVRVSLVLGVQFGVAGSLFVGDLESLGFPGRFTYFGMDNPGPKLVAGEQRRVVPLTLPRYWPGDAAREIGEMTFPFRVQQEIIDWDYDRSTVGGPAIDGHRMLLRLRLACVLALMDSAAQPELVHWQLAGELEKHSLATRSRVLNAVHELSTQHARTAGRMDMMREIAHHDARIEDRAERLATWLHGMDGPPVPWRRVRDRFNGDDRKQIESIVEYAVQRNWVSIVSSDGKRSLRAGERKPAR